MVGKVEQRLLALIAERGAVPVAPAKPQQQRRYDRLDQKHLIKISGGIATLTELGRKAHQRAVERKQKRRLFEGVYLGPDED